MGKCLSRCFGADEEAEPLNTSNQKSTVVNTLPQQHYSQPAISTPSKTPDVNTGNKTVELGSQISFVEGNSARLTTEETFIQPDSEIKIDSHRSPDQTITLSPTKDAPAQAEKAQENIDLMNADISTDSKREQSEMSIPVTIEVPSLDDPNPKPAVLNSMKECDELFKSYLAQSEEALVKALETNNSPYAADYEVIYEEKKEEHKLKIYLSSYITPEKNRVNKVRAEWYVPATPEQFINFMNNVQEQWKIDDGSMEKFYPLALINESNEHGYVVYYLSYKKQMIASARDMTYIKQFKKLEEDVYADSSVSIEHPAYQPVKNYVRCEFKAGGHIIKLISGKEDGKPVSFVRMCSESDFKTNVPLFMAKSFTQSSLKTYIEKCIKSLKTLHPHSA